MSSFVVSARKYRPNSFDELVGQEHVSNTLRNAIAKDQLAHAFLFTGPRGVGKTSSARILAKVINCENTTENGTKACNTCEACKAMEDNASFNIVELDAASNNSVEHIRNLNDQVRIRPQGGKYKIFIIDEVHMLSTAAFNAFLKTLEEPPSYAIFILATTEKNKILPTILSRCQIFNFKRIPVKEIVRQLQSIAEKESINIDANALFMIAQKSDGAMRDALSIFDKVSSTYEGQISDKQVAESLNLLDYDYFFKMIDMMLLENISGVYLLYDEIVKNGFNADIFVEGLASHVRDLLMCGHDSTIELITEGQDLQQRYSSQSKTASKSFLVSALDMLTQLDMNLPRVSNQHLHVEMALTKITYLNRLIEGSTLTLEKKSQSVSQMN